MKALSHPTLSEIDAQIDVLDRAEPTQNRMHWRRAFDYLKDALARARRIRRLALLPVLVVAALATSFLRGSEWDINDARLAFVSFFVLLALAHVALASTFAALQRESRIAALLRYYGDTTAHNDMAFME